MSEAIKTGFRLSPQQRRLWLWRQQQQGASSLDARVAVHLEGSLRAGVLREAVRAVVERHEVLRTGFECVPGMRFPVQVIADEAAVAWHVEDLRRLGEAARASRIEELLDEESTALNSSGGTNVRCALLTLSESAHVLLLTLPSLCADAATLKNFVLEVGHAYGALSGEGDAESEETVQYVQFSEWQNGLLEDDESAEGREYWRTRLGEMGSGGSVEVRLPWEGESASADACDARRAVVTLDAALCRESEDFAHRRGVRVADVLLACWAALLRRLTGLSDIDASVLCGGRVYEEMRGAFGPYAKWVPARFHVEDTFAFDELLSQVSKTTNAAEEWQEYYSWDEFEAEEASSRDGSSPLVGFEFDEWATPPDAAGVKFSPLKLDAGAEPFKLRLRGVRTNQALSVELHYDPRVYGAGAAGRLASHYAALLASVRKNPRAAIKDAEIVGASERERILREWNDTAAEFPSDKCLHELFEEQVRRTPESVAVVSGAASLTYAQLNARANRLARELRRSGVGPESTVALYVERSAEMVVALVGVLKAGGAYVPLDTGQPAPRLSAILSDAGVAAVVTQGHLAERLPADFANVIRVDSVREPLAPHDDENLPNLTRPENLAYVIYTSGSTGTPKGVCIRHRSAVNLWAALACVIYSGAPHGPLRVSVNAPLAFDSSFKQILQLLSGHALHVVPEEVRVDGEELLKFIREHALDVLDCTPSQLRLLVEAGLDGARGAGPSLLLVGGEPIDIELWDSLAAGDGWKCYNVYGPTECTVDATACLIAERESPRLGRALSNTQVYVLDDESRPVPVGVAGELHVGGEGLARGYLGRADLTAERFVPDTFSGAAGARLYKTGDMARWLPEGEIEYLGRRDSQVKVRGHRIELGEIEAALAGHEAVREAVVAAREDDRGDIRLVAYVVGGQDAAPSATELRNYLGERLPEYMLPSAFVTLKSLPLSRNGKVDRRLLPAPDESRPDSDKTHATPRTQVEEVLASVWAQVFGVERVGTDESFFEMGGHSLLATRVISRVRQLFQVELPVRALFEAPTVASLAERVETALRAGQMGSRPAIERVARGGPWPASFAQQRLWFLYELEPASTAYQLPVALRLRGALDAAVLERTFGEIVRRHEILRTTFATVTGQLVQVIAPTRPFNLPVVSLVHLREAEREAEARRLASEEAARPFDLTRDPVLRVTLLELAGDDCVLLLTMHHIASDEWSMNVLVREVLSLYAAFSEGRPSPLAELAIQYADYAAWQREWLGDEALETDLAYWRRHLGDGSHATELPSDRPRPPVQTYRGTYHPLELSESLTESLKSLSRGEGATLFMTLMAAFKILLGHHTRQEKVVVGVPVAGRNQVETEGLIGFFVNMLVMRADLSGDPGFRALLARVREVTLGAYAHGDVPFEKLVEKLRPERDLGRHPLFQIAFTFDATAPEPPAYPGLEVSPWGVEARTTRYELVLALRDMGRGVRGSFQYNTDLYNAARIARMEEHFKLLLERVAADPEVRLSELSEMLDEADRRRQDQKREKLKQARSRMLRTARLNSPPESSRKGEAVQ